MKDILEKLVSGELNVDEAENLLKSENILEFDDIAKMDIKRNQRAGFPEAIFAPSKDYDDLILIIKKYLKTNDDDLIITKLSHDRYEKIIGDLGENSFIFDYNRRAQILIIRKEVTKKVQWQRLALSQQELPTLTLQRKRESLLKKGAVKPSHLMILGLPESTGCFLKSLTWFVKALRYSSYVPEWREHFLPLLPVWSMFLSLEFPLLSVME